MQSGGENSMKKSELRKFIREEVINEIALFKFELNEEVSGYDAALKKFLAYGDKVFTKHNKSTFPDNPVFHEKIVVLKRGKRFDKVVVVKVDEPKKAQSVYAFIERETGHIFKAAGWNAPAKGPRASIMEPKSYKNMDAYGGWLYR